MQRRTFLTKTTQASLGLGLLGSVVYLGCGGQQPVMDSTTASSAVPPPTTAPLWFNISLAQWSLHKTLFAGKMDNLDFAATARNTFGLGGIEYVNQFFKDKAKNQDYLKQMEQRANDHGVKSLMIMVDGEGNLGDSDAKARTLAVENHYPWVDAAKFLGCHSIRVNAAGKGSREEVAKNATEGLAKLSEYAAKVGLNVIVENHGGFSSDGKWLADVIAATGMSNCGTLPDFGNFCMERGLTGCKEEYDRYQGVTELMPYAKAVSAKTHDFAADGTETHTDYQRMLKIVKDAGYQSWIGIEYEGSELSEEEGIKKTIALLESAGRMV